jgi:excinuclease ABC subunit C
MIELHLPQDEQEIERAIGEIPNRPAVFLLWAREGKPYLARTNVLRRRLLRLLATRESASRALNLQGTAERLEYRLTGSRLEAQMLLLEQARLHFGPAYRDAIRLRMPPYVKLILPNEFPRTHVTAHMGRAKALYYGPFRNRATAVRFESEFLDLFQLRRCHDDLIPAPDHPGCIYGEMGRCLRPCQQAVGVEEYRGEAQRVAEFLRTNGRSLAAPAESARERLSAEMDFEGAALMHQRCQRIAEVLAQSDEMARDVECLNAVAVTQSAITDAVELGWLRGGMWRGFSQLDFTPAADGTAVSLDTRVRELAMAVPTNVLHPLDRMERLAVLSRWFYSGWRDGELLIFDDWEKPPYRKLVNAVSRVAQQGPAQAPAKPRPSSHS